MRVAACAASAADSYFLSGTVPCWGERDAINGRGEGGSVTADATGIVDAIQRGSEVAGVFVGHKHCSNYCCAANGTNFCFGAHSSTGGYVCAANGVKVDSVQVDWPGIGVRLIELTAPPDGTWRIETRIALVNGSTVYGRVLAEGRYMYP